jgi:Family of unknown function (DUF6328)
VTDEGRGQPGESDEERFDRELIELLNELRVALPGVQVLFAFLLVVPFQQRFATVTSFQETVYFVTLLLAAASCAFLIAPSAHHRILFRAQEKRHLLVIANGLAIVGMGFLAAALVGVLMLITDFLYGTTTTIVVTAAAAGLFAALWYALPLRRR